MNKIKKAVIPAAGLGTRFLPVTKAIPKELLPIVDVPTLEIILEEAAASGIEEVLLVVSEKKQAIRDHFAPAAELEAFLHAHGKDALADRIKDIPNIVKLSYIVQEEPRGLGHAVSLARDFAAGEPIAVLLGDDVVAAEPPALAQLIRVYESCGASVIGVQPVAESVIHKYGIGRSCLWRPLPHPEPRRKASGCRRAKQPRHFRPLHHHAADLRHSR